MQPDVSVDFDAYQEHLPVFRDAWLNRDYSMDFYRQRQKQVFVYAVLKHYAELLTEGLYSQESPAECTFAIDVSYSDKFGQQQTLTGVSWKFSRERAKQVVWEKFDP